MLIDRPPAERNADEVIRAIRSLEQSYMVGVEGVTEVWLVRHADVYDALEDLHDPGLSPRGRQQAARFAERVSGLDFAAVYASPSRRGQETARALGREVRTDPRLMEASVSFGGGRMRVDEPVDQVIARLRAAVDDAVEEHAGKRVLMFGHGVAILNYLAEVLRLEPGTLRMFPPYTGVSIVRGKQDRRVVATLFDVAHLEGAS